MLPNVLGRRRNQPNWTSRLNPIGLLVAELLRCDGVLEPDVQWPLPAVSGHSQLCLE